MSFTGEGPDHAREALIQANERLLESGQGADLTIITKDGSKNYHSAIVCPRSSVLSAAYWGSFKEGVTKTIDLSADTPAFVDKMMCYFYLLDYPYCKNLKLGLHAGMYIIGDKFDIPDLRMIAIGKFTCHCEALGTIQPKRLLEWYPGLFRDVLPLAFNHLPESDQALRKPLAQTIAPCIIANPTMVDSEDYRSYCLEYPLFGLDMQKEILRVAHVSESYSNVCGEQGYNE
ncbi:MAG: hypothetical protein Q9198_005034 [Flavoplaca austrocitrina]